MRHWETLAEYDRDGFNVIVDKTWEDCHPSDLFDTSTDPDTGLPYYDVEEISRKIDRGDLDWFMLRVRVMYEDLELAVDYVGGFLYEDAREVLTDGVAEDMIETALDDAKLRVPALIAGLSTLVVDTETV